MCMGNPPLLSQLSISTPRDRFASLMRSFCSSHRSCWVSVCEPYSWNFKETIRIDLKGNKLRVTHKSVISTGYSIYFIVNQRKLFQVPISCLFDLGKTLKQYFFLQLDLFQLLEIDWILQSVTSIFSSGLLMTLGLCINCILISVLSVTEISEICFQFWWDHTFLPLLKIIHNFYSRELISRRKGTRWLRWWICWDSILYFIHLKCYAKLFKRNVVFRADLS